MYKPNSYNHKGNMEKKSIQNNGYNLLSPPFNPKSKTIKYFNNNIPKFKPIALYQNCLSPDSQEKNFSVNLKNSIEVKVNQNLINSFSNIQKNFNSKIFQSPNTNNSDLCTTTSFNSQKSNDSLLSKSPTSNQYIPATFQVLVPNNYSVCQFPNHRKVFSMINNSNFNQNNYFYNNNNPFLNGMNSRNIENNLQQGVINNKLKKNNQNNKFKFQKKSCTNKNDDNKILNGNNKTKNDEKIEINNSISNNSSKSGKASNNSTKICSSSLKSDKKLNENNKKKYFNKFNSPKENCVNENTVILSLQIKVGPKDIRVFNLKKYDDLFVSLEKFFDINQIRQDLVKPIVTKIFEALNKIFWLLNNKIGNYDLEYLNSLYKLWIKNNQQIPKVKKSNEKEEIKCNNKSTISSSDSSDGEKKHKNMKSNSFQNMDSNSEDGKEYTSKSF